MQEAAVAYGQEYSAWVFGDAYVASFTDHKFGDTDYVCGFYGEVDECMESIRWNFDLDVNERISIDINLPYVS